MALRSPSTRALAPLALALALALPGAAAAAGGTASPPVTLGPAEPPPPVPAAIPLTGLIHAADEAYRGVQRAEARLEEAGVAAPVAERLPAAEADVDRAVKGPGPLADLDARTLGDVKQTLRRTQAQLAGWDERLDAEVRELDRAASSLTAQARTWTLTEEAGRAAGAPAPLLARAVGLRERLEAVARRAAERRAASLAVQDRVATLRQEIDGELARADRVERARAEQLFEIESVPLHRLLLQPARPASLRDQAVRSIQFHWGTLSAFARDEAAALVGLAALLAALAAAAWWIGRRLGAGAAAEPVWAAPAQVLARPAAAAALITLAVAFRALPRAPLIAGELLLLGMLVAFLRAMGALLPVRARWWVHALAIGFALDALGSLAPEYSLLGRLVLLAVDGLLLGAAWRATHRPVWADELSAGWRRPAVWALWGTAAVLAVAVAANVIGNVNLARLLTSGTLVSSAGAVLLAGLERVLQALAAGGLRMPGARRVGVVARHGELLADRTRVAVRWVAVAAWLWLTARAYHVDGHIAAAAGAVLDWRLRVGGLDLALGDLLRFGVTLAAAVLLSRLVAFVLEEGLEGRGLPRGVPAAVSRTAQYAVVGVGAVFALMASGMEMTRFTVLIGTLGVGIGFGLQNVVNNFVSGLILIYERPMQVGDVVEIGALSGVVRRIGIRSSTLGTFQGAEVVVPNADLISGHLVNWTLSDRTRRMEIDLGVAYGTDPDRVVALLLELAMAHPDVLADPAPAALFTGFGESALTFQLRAWTRRWDGWGQVASELRTAICRRLAAEGIAIPFPQRDLHLIAGPAPAAEAGAAPAAAPRNQAVPPLPPGGGPERR
ncbi:MAG: mechanosensitive ion channel [Anaeromyxobacter sp.]